MRSRASSLKRNRSPGGRRSHDGEARRAPSRRSSRPPARRWHLPSAEPQAAIAPCATDVLLKDNKVVQSHLKQLDAKLPPLQRLIENMEKEEKVKKETATA